MDENVKVFLIGKGDSIVGTTDDKQYAKAIVEERQGDYNFIKVKDAKAKMSISRAYLPEVVNCFGELIFSDEEEFCIQSFEQYHMDAVRYIERALEIFSYLKFSNKEKEILSDLLIELVEYLEAMKHGTLYEDEDGGMLEYFNYPVAVKWYKENVLGIKGCKK